MSPVILKFRIASVQCLNTALRSRAYLCLALLLPLLFLLAGCTTGKTYKPSMAAPPPKPAGYPIPIYSSDMSIPRTCQLIGQVKIGDTGFTMFGGSADEVMKTLMNIAHEKGADVVQVIAMEKPGFTSQNYGVEANLLRYADAWETVALSEKDFLAYLQQHQQTLDPIEGLWTDGSADRFGIIRDTSKPGREFVAFTLNPRLPSWHVGFKKADIAHAARPGAYTIRYYREDFSDASTTVLLDRNRSFNFLVHAVDGTYPVTFIKLNVPAAAN